MKIQDLMPPEWGEWVNPKKDLMMELPKLKLYPRQEQCPCGKTVEDRVVNCSYIQLQKHKPQKALSQSCSICYKWYNPIKDEWLETPHQSRRAILRDYFYYKAK